MSENSEKAAKEAKLAFNNQLLQPRDPAETKKLYAEWAKNYEQDLPDIDYNGPELAVNGFLEMDLPKSSRILDIAAGTGIIGCLLQKKGYEDIDAVEPSEEMIEIAKQKNCYKNIIISFVSKDIRLPFEDQTYDSVIMAGCLGPGHIKYDSFPEIIRITKSGGSICWCMALTTEYKERDPLFSEERFEKYIELLCSQHKWTHISGFPKRVENYSRGNNGWVYAMKVL